MSILDKSLQEIHEALKSGAVTSKELTEESLKRAHKYQDELNSFVTIIDDAKESEVTDNVLSGIQKTYLQPHHQTSYQITFQYLTQLLLKS